MTDPVQGELAAACTILLDKGDSAPKWSWEDDRSAALLVFGIGESGKISALLEKAFPNRWDADTIRAAAGEMAELADALGGLREGQRLYFSQTVNGASLAGTWWPWGNGQTISLRVFMVCDEGQEAGTAEQLREWFGLSA